MCILQSLNAAPELGEHFSLWRLKKRYQCFSPGWCATSITQNDCQNPWVFPQAPQQTVNIVAELQEVEVPEVQAVAEVFVAKPVMWLLLHSILVFS